ncbi:CYFA0S26e00232g1_1 [Cyberlindnera fabianii]|uniref:CYFA0S26e00232g1_1 n=1 Tax=Cyberlindnera fabianii TaxID=36022 RepID=A0A061BA34_CYBFA|nr:hypothetical protein BON22_4381 [Cyberlindnera fabianii]CDR46799.1 CYFA0S26e00232g1_1 [Cyberlindnera fabianii]
MTPSILPHSIITWAFLLLVVAAIAAFHFRSHWLPRLRAWRASRNISLGRYEALSSFQSDLEAGLSSGTFNIGANVSSGDSRQGLDDTAKKQVLKIMEEKGISFDEARLEYIKKKLADNQIGPDGTPLDPKAVTFGK